MRRNLCRLGKGGLAVGLLLFGALPARAAGPFQFFSLTPCRLFDTRAPSGPTGGAPMADQVADEFEVQGVCGVPVGATAVTVNATAVGPTGAGFLTLYPTGITRPVVSSLNFNAGEPALGNGAIVPLADQAVNPLDLSVFPKVVGPGTVHVVLDVTGYFQ